MIDHIEINYSGHKQAVMRLLLYITYNKNVINSLFSMLPSLGPQLEFWGPPVDHVFIQHSH